MAERFDEPRIRDDLELIWAGPRRVVVRDLGGGPAFELSAQAAFVVRRLDGTRDPESIRRDYECQYGEGLSRRRFRELMAYLAQQGLLADSLAVPNGRPRTPRLWLPVSQAVLNGFFDVLVALVGFLVHPLWIVPILAMTALGTVAVVSNLDRFAAEMADLLDVMPLPLLFAISFTQTIFFVNLPRELMIGIAARKHRGYVRHFEIRFAGGFVPFFNCDHGPLFFLRRRGRWSVLTAGVWTQLAIGACAAVIWSMLEPGTALSAFFLILVPPVVILMVLHADIFLPLDGYRMVCTAVRDPFVRERARAEAKAWFTPTAVPAPMGRRERFWLRCYGAGWYVRFLIVQIVAVAGGGYWLQTRFGPTGVLVGALAYLWWFRRPIRRILLENALVAFALARLGPWPKRLAYVSAVVAVPVLAFWPYSQDVSGVCRLRAETEYGVRAQVSDEIAGFYVTEGDWVTPGTAIASLRGRDVHAQYEGTKALHTQAQAQLDLLRAGARAEDLEIARLKVEIRARDLAWQEDQLARSGQAARADVVNPRHEEYNEERRIVAQRLHQSAVEAYERLVRGAREEVIRAAVAEVERLESRLDYHTDRLGLLNLDTPIGGRVRTAGLETRAGQYAGEGDLLAIIEDDRHLMVEVAADEAAANLVRPGMRARIRLRGSYGGLLEGTVTHVSRHVEETVEFRSDAVHTDVEQQARQRLDRNPGEYNVRVYVEFDDPPDNLKPGMSGAARIVIAEGTLGQAVYRSLKRFAFAEIWPRLP